MIARKGFNDRTNDLESKKRVCNFIVADPLFL